jgi:dTDP-4-amino-4,6-dideoxygalactose transaminase
MTVTLESPSKPLALPSDQEASGRTLGREEIALVTEVLRSGTLTSTKGPFVTRLEQRFAHLLGTTHATACSSGTAAIHTAIAALDLEPGDEIITSPITDMGALTPILYQGAIPVFADVDPRTCNLTATAIAARLGARTRAIIVTHLFGNPCPMAEIMALARAHELPVIEDCAQAFLAKSGDQSIGAIGAIGCFSLQQGKHITAGEGGLVVTSDSSLARRMRLFVNKAWGYGDANPDHSFLALNYRLSELQGAVAVAQLDKLQSVIDSRISAAERVTFLLEGLPGIETPYVQPGDVHTYWKYCLHVDPELIHGGATGLAAVLRGRGIACVPRYIQKPAFQCEVFQKQRTFGTSRYPFTLARPEALDYDRRRFPGTFAALDRILVLPWTERYTDEHLNYLAEAIYSGVEQLCTEKV